MWLNIFDHSICIWQCILKPNVLWKESINIILLLLVVTSTINALSDYDLQVTTCIRENNELVQSARFLGVNKEHSRTSTLSLSYSFPGARLIGKKGKVWGKEISWNAVGGDPRGRWWSELWDSQWEWKWKVEGVRDRVEGKIERTCWSNGYECWMKKKGVG